MSKIFPLGERVLVQREKAKTKSAGGILLPDQAQEKPRTGVVLAVGPGLVEDGILVPPAVKEDDTVLFSPYSTHEVNLGERGEDELILINCSDLLAIIK